MLKKKNILILLLGIVLGVFIGICSSVFAELGNDNEANVQPAITESLPYDDLRNFTEIFGRIKRDYVEPVSDKKLLEDAVRGMLSGLDPHSTYLGDEEYKELKEGTTGQFGGLGIEVSMEDGYVKVVSPIDDTPASKAGILAGDLIIKLDERPVKGMSLAEAVKLMRGEPGSEITLTVVREGSQMPLKIVIARAVINVKSVKSRVLEPGYGYIRISSFQSKTDQNLRDALKELTQNSKQPLKGLVLDLRNNPGGVLDAAVGVSDAFLTNGLIVYTEGRIKNSEMRFNASPDDLLAGAPIVALINAGSASASEIVAGALQDHHRAIIMGEKSFGKGSVQTVLPTSNGGAIKLTTARYYTPSGRSIQAEGIEPDIVLGRVKLESLENEGVKPVKEADLSHHLQNGNVDKNAKPETKAKEADSEAATTAPKSDKKSQQQTDLNDYPLHEALTLLKGVGIFKK